MTLNASGPISLGGSTAGQSINLELGQSATAQVSLNDTNVRSLAGVASGAIVMPTNFYGKSSVAIDFLDRFVSGTGFSSAQAGYQIVGTTSGGLSAGNDYEFVNFNFPANPNQWITPTSQAANYEVYATLAGGDPLSGGTLNTWVAVSTNPAWNLDAFGSNVYKTSVLNFEVRRTGTATVLDTWTVELYAGAD
jgi:hypothetical protein